MSNKKLLNGMHEGLLILSKKDAGKNVLFCNRPVRTLLARALNSHIKAQEDSEMTISQKIESNGNIVRKTHGQNITNPCIFQPAKIAVKDQVKKFEQVYNVEDSSLINLDQIITT